jgi:hypothetical protein
MAKVTTDATYYEDMNGAGMIYLTRKITTDSTFTLKRGDKLRVENMGNNKFTIEKVES